jgi:hypothetical protein
MVARETVAVAVAQWQSTGLWLQRLGVQIPSVTPTLSNSERRVPMSAHYAPTFFGLFSKLHGVPRIAVEPWPAIGRCGMPSEPAGNGQAVVA